MENFIFRIVLGTYVATFSLLPSPPSEIDSSSFICDTGRERRLGTTIALIFFFFLGPLTIERNCPDACPLISDQVCGSDNQDYINRCFLRKKACEKGVEITEVSKGACRKYI